MQVSEHRTQTGIEIPVSNFSSFISSFVFVLPLRAWRFAGKGKVVPNDNRHLNVVWVCVGGLIRGASMWNQPCCVSQLDFDMVRGTSSSTSCLCKLCMESNGISESSVLIALV